MRYKRGAGEKEEGMGNGRLRMRSQMDLLASGPQDKEESRGLGTSTLQYPAMYRRVALHESISYGKEGYVSDACLSLGRSFRAGWGVGLGGMTLVHTGRVVGFKQLWKEAKEEAMDLGESTGSAESIEEMERDEYGVVITGLQLGSKVPSLVAGPFPSPVDVVERGVMVEGHVKALEAQLAMTTWEEVDGGAGQAKWTPGMTLSRLGHLQGALHPGAQHSIEGLTWGLAAALFDPLEGTDVELKGKRRLALSRWLESAVRPQVDRDLDRARGDMDDLKVRQSLGQPLPSRRQTEDQGNVSLDPSEGEHQRGEVGARIIFALLSGNRVVAACDEAARQGNLRLATLLAQVGGGSGCQEEVRGQVEAWRKTRDGQGERWAWIGGADRQRLWSLLGGNVGAYTSLDRGTGRVEQEGWVGEGLDWKRLLGLLLWYTGNDDAGIEDVVKQLDGMLRENVPGMTRAVPWYEQGTVASKNSQGDASDILYHILQLYGRQGSYPLEELLQPRNYGPSPLDYRLGWQLSHLMGPLGHWKDGEDLGGTRLTEDLAWELECLGLWEWAIYALSWLKDRTIRERTIRDLLSRHSDELGHAGAKEMFLKEKLRIPMTWAWEAKATRARWEGAVEEEVDWLIRAGQWKEAHDKIIHDLAADWILEGRLDKLKAQLEAIRVGLHVRDGPGGPKMKDDEEMGEGGGTKAYWETGGWIFLEFVSLSESFRQVHGTWKKQGAALNPQRGVEGPVKDFAVRIKTLLVALGKMAEGADTRREWQSEVPVMGFPEGINGPRDQEDVEEQDDLAWQVCLAKMARQLTRMMTELGVEEDTTQDMASWSNAAIPQDERIWRLQAMSHGFFDGLAVE
ncbi:nuclear protein 96-domain-containing protein [Piptocephalis cylindrospora]|uniref:Nuclear protein 96-domain-containing protein n=1 Tax=Piptocephalis cylindrospora TaxID=1907219 RepID=A0A4P9Y2T2_9FUNG|nr:nuclear protein 96-domain-containing protein [Piptocephalis cylindrospora]|eukprot:RKP13218.1 nuclear protein 96-domain-containing protein [Piptocephalis cylindrospora]